MGKIKKIVIIILLIGGIVQPSINSENIIYSNEELIDEFTWSVIKYTDYMKNQVNKEMIYTSKPSYGPLLILSNYMSPALCKVALEVYCEKEDGSLNESKTLRNLVDYVNESVVHYSAINYDNDSTFPNGDIFCNFNVFNAITGKKISVQEMALLGDHFENKTYDFIGDCYSVSSFITTVLRLCGFSAKDVFNVNIAGSSIPITLVDKIPIVRKPLIGGHEINFVKAEDNWYIIDGTMWRNSTDGRLFFEKEKYQFGKIIIIKDFDMQNMTAINRFFFKDKVCHFENDKYFLGQSWQYESLWNIYSNMNTHDFRKIFTAAFTDGFNNARFSYLPYLSEKLFVLSISNRAKPHPSVSSISIPYTVDDAVGDSIDEKAHHLAHLNYEFIWNQTSKTDVPNQFDKAFYAYGLLDLSYPQAYANAARLAAHTSWFGYTNDTDTPYEDANSTISWIRENIKVNQILDDNQVAFSDLTFSLRNGSTVDQAVFTYGAMRNMKHGDNFWSADDLFVIVTNENRGYFAVNGIGDGWMYLNFGEGAYIQNYIENVRFAFNEKVRLDEWDK